MPKKLVYLDYAATTPVDPKVLKAMTPYFNLKYGNPSSIYSLGEESKIAVDESRKKVSAFLHCQQEEVIFTGSATEANNFTIKGVVLAFKNSNPESVPHIITSMIEHHAVLEPFKQLEKTGVETTYLPVDQSGHIKVSDLAKAIKENTILVSVMYANNEIGCIQPISQIGKLIKDINQLRQGPKSSRLYFHSDAVQAINYLDCDVKKLGVDMLSFSGHKIYGPKGVGVLFLKKGVPIDPLLSGGGQEFGLRSGTENVAGIVGLGKALEEASANKAKISYIEKLRERLIKEVMDKISDAELNSALKNSMPNIINFSFKGVEGEAVVLALDQKGIYVSTGSACASRSLEPSHVLLALGLNDEEAHASVRFALGKYTTKEDVDYVIKVLPPIIDKLRKISGYNN